MFKRRSVTRSAALLPVAAIVLMLGNGAAFGASWPHCKQVHGRLVDQVQFAGRAVTVLPARTTMGEEPSAGAQ